MHHNARAVLPVLGPVLPLPDEVAAPERVHTENEPVPPYRCRENLSIGTTMEGAGTTADQLTDIKIGVSAVVLWLYRWVPDMSPVAIFDLSGTRSGTMCGTSAVF